MGKKKIKQMKGEEIIQEVAKLFKENLTPTFNKLFLIRDLLPENGHEAPKVIQDLNKSLNASGEMGLSEILDEAIGGLDGFCLFIDFLQMRIAGGEKVKPKKGG